MKHTRGPWRISTKDSYQITALNDLGHDIPIAQVNEVANAGLISTAPDLILALVVLNNWICELGLERRHDRDGIPQDVMEMVRNNIEKAIGGAE